MAWRRKKRCSIPCISMQPNCTGWLYELKAASQHGAKFNSSVGRSPSSFQIDGGRVIKGWDVNPPKLRNWRALSMVFAP
jgi:hypothetical protein